MSCGVGRRHGSDLALLCLWRRPMATDPIGPLAWEPPYAAGAALKRQRKEKMSDWAAIIWSLDWGGRIHFQDFWLKASSVVAIMMSDGATIIRGLDLGGIHFQDGSLTSCGQEPSISTCYWQEASLPHCAHLFIGLPGHPKNRATSKSPRSKQSRENQRGSGGAFYDFVS